MAQPKFQSPTGMHDVLPHDQEYFKKIRQIVEKVASWYAFEKIDTPVAEQAELFTKGVGMGTDIVEKEMYTFRTKGGDALALRPEGTAPIARSYIEHGMSSLPQPVKLWYFQPFFRHERPQAGRYRQFWQFGFELLGEQDSIRDAQLILVFANILEDLKIKNVVIEVNSIGDNQCRPAFKKVLANYYKGKEHMVCAQCRKRLAKNPLRVLDCKEEKCQIIKSQAPQIIDHLCTECHEHFKSLLELLEEAKVPYRLNPHLVRGLDYYTKTVFEIFQDSDEGQKMGALCAGGRYDGLVKLVGGKDTPAVGGACGMERLLVALHSSRQLSIPEKSYQVYVTQIGQAAKYKALPIFEELRRENITAAEDFGSGSLKGQLSKANRLGVRFTIIIGQKEVLEETAIIRNMKTGKQEIVPLAKTVREVKKRLRSAK